MPEQMVYRPQNPCGTTPQSEPAIGYLRTDISTDPGFDTARLRLTAIAHGYTLAEILTAPDATHYALLPLALDHHTATTVLTPHPCHLSPIQQADLRTRYHLHTGTTLLPRWPEPHDPESAADPCPQ